MQLQGMVSNVHLLPFLRLREHLGFHSTIKTAFRALLGVWLLLFNWLYSPGMWATSRACSFLSNLTAQAVIAVWIAWLIAQRYSESSLIQVRTGSLKRQLFAWMFFTILVMTVTSGAALPLQIILVHGHQCLFFKVYFCAVVWIWALGINEKVEVIGFSNHHYTIAIGNSNQ